jgi:hypothetical protein
MDKTVKEYKEDIILLRKALDAAILALDDWTNSYAPEFCEEFRVKMARDRIIEHGTLWYIATVVEQCRKAKKATNETCL